MTDWYYGAGTITVSAGGTLVAAAGADFASVGIHAGEMLVVGGLTAVIAAATADTLTLASPWSGPAVTDGAYQIVRLYANTAAADLAAQQITLVRRWRDLINQLSDWAGGEAIGGPAADGRYPLAKPDGSTTLIPSPAKIAADAKGAWTLVRDFGAVGDGVTDDSAAINAATASGARVIVLDASKTYAVKNSVKLYSDQTLVGTGATLRLTGTATTGDAFNLGSLIDMRDCQDSAIHDLTLIHPLNPIAVGFPYLIVMNNAVRCNLRGLRAILPDTQYATLFYNDSNYNRFTDLTLVNVGVQLATQGGRCNFLSNAYIRHGSVTVTGDKPGESTDNNTILGVTIEDSWGMGVEIYARNPTLPDTFGTAIGNMVAAVQLVRCGSTSGAARALGEGWPYSDVGERTVSVGVVVSEPADLAICGIEICPGYGSILTAAQVYSEYDATPSADPEYGKTGILVVHAEPGPDGDYDARPPVISACAVSNFAWGVNSVTSNHVLTNAVAVNDPRRGGFHVSGQVIGSVVSWNRGSSEISSSAFGLDHNTASVGNAIKLSSDVSSTTHVRRGFAYFGSNNTNVGSIVKTNGATPAGAAFTGQIADGSDGHSIVVVGNAWDDAFVNFNYYDNPLGAFNATRASIGNHPALQFGSGAVTPTQPFSSDAYTETADAVAELQSRMASLGLARS
jgi:hypothetical protein